MLDASSHLRLRSCSFFLLCLALLLPAGAFAQYANQDNQLDHLAGQRRESRAEKQAEDKVAFAPETIIAVLRREPGLMLEVKRMLVRQAFETGRVLDANELTDDQVFQLIRDDQQARVLATHEIEERGYIRPKPTQEEIQREAILASQLGIAPRNGTNTQLPQSSNLRSLSQEQAYWAAHDAQLGGLTVPNQLPQTTAPSEPAPNQQNSAPQNNPQENPARQLNSASLDQGSNNQGPNNYDSGDVDSALMKMSPEQLSNLASANPQAAMALASSGAASASLGTSSGNLNAASLQQPNSFFNFPSQSQLASASFPSSQSSNPQSQKSRTPSFPSVADLNQDRPQIRQKPNPYADVPSLYDLYSQVSRRPAVLEQFGMNVFRSGTGNTDELPLDLPVGPDYVLGPGDGLSIELWGAVSQRLQRTVDRAGLVALPEVGTVHVAGRKLGDVQQMVQTVLRTQFRDVAADVSLGRIRSVRVYVVGDVERPGAYDISSLSTPLNALYAAGGPTSRGSLRHIRQFRGKQLVQELDAYDLLLHGIHADLARLESGDTILVPPMGGQVTVEGMVRRPAIYEISDEKSLAEVLQLAGGVLPSGTLRQVDVERVLAHQSRTMLQLDIPETNNEQAVNTALDSFQVEDGDKIRISPILPYAEKTVYLDGHVFHPGKYPYRDGMSITDLIHSYRDLLPEPSRQHAEIIRLEAPDYRPVVMTFNLADAMAGKIKDLALKPFDTVRIYSRFDFEDSPAITINGAVRDPGEHLTNGEIHLRDAVFLAGGLTADAQTGDVQVYRRTTDGKMKILSANLQKALENDTADNILLQPRDQVMIASNPKRDDPATVRIEGDVQNPGKYPLGEGMTAAQLVQLAGGFKRSADVELADLMTYPDVPGGGRLGEQRTVQIGKALAGEEDTDVRLHDGDVLSIRQLPGWRERGAFITIKGEVVRPGSYGIREGERLSSVLERAGGFRPDVYTYATIFEREDVRKIQEKDRADLITRVQAEGSELKMAPDSDPESKMAKDAVLLQWQAALEKLMTMPPSGRMVVHISSNVKSWANTQWDPVLRSGDTIIFPKKPGYVTVTGAVYNSTGITFRPNRNAGWYLKQAGGATIVANKKSIFLVRADGSIVGGTHGILGGGVLAAEVRPGDMLVVPERAYYGSTKWKAILQTSQLVSAVGIAISVASSF